MATRAIAATRPATSGRLVTLDPPDYPALWGLFSHHKMNEGGGTRYDSVGDNDLSDVATVASAAGKFNLCAAPLLSNSEALTIADKPSLRFGNSDWLALAWIQYVSSGRPFFGKWGSVGTREWYVETSSSIPRAQFSANGTLVTTVSATTFGALSTATWYLLGVYHDSVNDLVGVSVNGVWDTAAHTGGLHGAAAPFEVARINSLATPLYGSSLIEELSIFKDPPGGIAGVRDEIATRVYHEGAGRPYPWRD